MNIMGKIIFFVCLVAALCANAATRPASPTRLYPVVKDGKWGYIDEAGRIVIAPHFDAAGGFKDERALISIGGKPGYIDTAGQLISTPPFDVGGDFSEGLAPVNVGQRRDSNLGFITEQGRWGYINQSGALVIPMKFQKTDEFHEGLAAAHLGDASGFIDHAGRFVFNAPLDVSWGFSEGVVLVKSNLKMYFLDRTGRRLPTPTLDDNYQPGLSFHEGLAGVQIKDLWGFIDKTGRLVIPAQFIKTGDFSESLAAAEVLIDQNKETPCPLSENSTYIAAAKFGYIDHAGKMVIAPNWEYASPFVDGLASVSNCYKASFIDMAGRVAIKTRFNVASSFAGPFARVSLDGSIYGYIDKTGKVVWEPLR
jgi:WG containing repeat